MAASDHDGKRGGNVYEVKTSYGILTAWTGFGKQVQTCIYHVQTCLYLYKNVKSVHTMYVHVYNADESL